jgi:hypothetical protein
MDCMRFKRNFKRFSLQHNIRASYTINQYRSNFDYEKHQTEWMPAVTFFNKTIMSNVPTLFEWILNLKVH